MKAAVCHGCGLIRDLAIDEKGLLVNSPCGCGSTGWTCRQTLYDSTGLEGLIEVERDGLTGKLAEIAVLKQSFDERDAQVTMIAKRSVKAGQLVTTRDVVEPIIDAGNGMVRILGHATAADIDAYFGAGSGLAGAVKAALESQKPTPKRPSVKGGSFCKRCGESFNLEATCGYEVHMKNCSQCAHFILVGKAFEEVARFLEKIESLVDTLWETDPIIVAEVKIRAELTDEDIDIETVQFGCINDLDVDEYEHEDMRTRRSAVEDYLYRTNWKGRLTHCWQVVFNLLANQWKRNENEWPLNTLWAWHGQVDYDTLRDY